MILNIISKLVSSLFGNFLIGGFTVAGVAYLSNTVHNTLLASLIATLPIAMPCSIFVHDDRVKSYSSNLVIMGFVLWVSVIANWYFISKLEINKYKAVMYSMGVFWLLGIMVIILKNGD